MPSCASAFRKEVVAKEAKAFIAAKLAERDARHLRAGQSRYLVEPDVKDGKGGLRDLQTLFWIARFLHGVEQPDELIATGLFTREEFNRFMRAEDFLWAVRCHLHFIAGRGDDRLSFDKQAEIAERLGYNAHGGLKHVERFMKHYFLIAKDVGDLTRIFCAVLEAQEMKKVPRLTELISGLARRTRVRRKQAPRFRLDAGRLNVLNRARVHRRSGEHHPAVRRGRKQEPGDPPRCAAPGAALAQPHRAGGARG